MDKIDIEALKAASQYKGHVAQLDDQNAAVYFEGSDTLVVTFDNLADARNEVGEGRLPFGSAFVTKRGWSSLGLMTQGWTWFRDPSVADYFDDLRDKGFFARFSRVVFYGISMGGYAAAAYSSAAPGAVVLAMNPQATLDRARTTPWEVRYRQAWLRDFTGRYGYAPDEVKAASKVHLFYDPKSEVQDSVHAALFHGDNIDKYACPFFGHGIATSLRRMLILNTIVEGCISGTLSSTAIYQLLRARRDAPQFQRGMLRHLLALNRPWLTYTYCDAVIRRSDKFRPHFHRAREAARAQLGKA